MRFYDYQCTNDVCNNVQEYYEKTNDDEKYHHCQRCFCKMKRKISLPMVNFQNARGNGKPNNSISKKERQRRWNSPDPKDKI
jgi:predicted nucleic acid-binding Zn ribbon protein